MAKVFITIRHEKRQKEISDYGKSEIYIYTYILRYSALRNRAVL
jgi:hypothetical protein